MIEASVSAIEAVSTQTERIHEVKEPKELDVFPTSFQAEIVRQTDVFDNPDSTYIICRNESLEGESHPITGVDFILKEIELPDGTLIEGVFPVFDSAFDAKLDDSQYTQSDAQHFKEANSQLKEEVKNNPELRGIFSTEQLEQIELGDTPDGYVWHHSEETGKLQLVDSNDHAQTGHTGGRSIWGGGSDNR